MLCVVNMDASIARYCLSLLLLALTVTSDSNNGTNQEEPRVPRVSGRIVKLYSGPKPEPHLCTDEGFQADLSNCAIFYRCVKERSGKFTVFRYQCAPGTVYDPDLETCNHPHSTSRAECGGKLKSTSEPYHITNVNEINGAVSELPRPISTKAPIHTEQTKIKTSSTLSWILATERQSNPTKIIWQSTKYNAPSTVATSQHTSKQGVSSLPHEVDNKLSDYKVTSSPTITQVSNLSNDDPCTGDGFMGDSINCRKFYRCVSNQRGGYIKYEFSCSESTVWDDEIQGCNHPWAVKRSKCGRSLTYDDTYTSQKTRFDSTERATTKQVTNNEGFGYKLNKTVQQQLQISYGSKVSQTQTQISNTPEVIQNQTQISHGDINKNMKYSQSKQNQTQISYENASSQTQTQITYGNKEGSKSVQTQLQIDHSKDSSQSQVQIQESKISQPAKATEQITYNNVSKSKCSESGFMGDANDCKKFYRCVDNGKGSYTTFEYLCGDGTVWDPEIEACNHAWAVKNCGNKLPSVSVTEEHTKTTTQATEYYSHSTKALQNMYTTSHVPDIDEKNDVGYDNQNNQDLTTSPTTTVKTTVMPTPRPTPGSLGATSECTTSGFIGDANDCNIFYRCVDNGSGGFIKYEFKCGDGTVWDPNIEACNHAWAVKDCGTLSTSINTDKQETTTVKEITSMSSDSTPTTITLVHITTQTPPETDDEGYGSQNHKPSTATIETTKQPQGQENNKSSVCKTSEFMGDENDCNKFYRCVDNGNGGYIRYEFTCGEGTVWDPKIEACNHAWAVEKCGKSNNVIDNTESSSESILTTSSGDTSSIQTTQVIKEPDTPITTSSTSTTIGIVERDKCTSSGFIGDRKNCNKFYRCVDNSDGTYTRYEFLCGEGTVWDSKIEACNHAWAVENCGGGGSDSMQDIQQTTSLHPIIQDEEQESGYATPSNEASETPYVTSSISQSATPSESSQCNKSGFMGDRYDCKKFYRCVDNGKGSFDRYEFRCGEGTVWDGTIEACNHAWATKGCVTNASGTTHFQNESTTQSISSSDTSEDNYVQTSTVKTTTITNESNNNAELGSDECLQNGFFGSKKDCKKFYRCVNNGKGAFTKYEFKCGDGTAWNQDIQGCDHMSSNSLCGSTSHVTTSPAAVYLDDDMGNQASSSTSIVSTVETASEVTQTTKIPQTSQDTCKSEGFYANHLDCKKFYRCVVNSNGGYTKYDFSCGDGTIWNQEIQGCDHESADKTCVTGSVNYTNVTESQSESTTVSYSTTKRKEEENVTNKIDSTEAIENECKSEGFYAHPYNCKKFIRCVNNGKGGYTRYEFSCGDGTVWVQEIQACDHDNYITSCASQSGSTTESKPQNIDNVHSSSTLDSNTVSSTEFMIPNREDDEYDTENSQEPLHDETDHCTSEGYFANKQDCRKFYRCVSNGNGGFTKYDFTCGDGTAWDSNLQTCNYISDVQSCSGSTQEGSEHQQTTTNKNQGESESSSSTIKTTTSPSESVGSSGLNKDENCENEGYYGDKTDCKKFYRCVDNGNGGYTKYEFTCGDGTIWDQDITNCNHPRDVSNPSCDSNQGSSDSSSTTSSTTTASSQNTSSTTDTSSQSTSDCSQDSSKNPTNNNITCEKAGYYANPNDCKKFYRCVDWDDDGKRFSVFHFECGEGTIWDPALDTCNHEDSVYPQRNCSQTQSQGVGGETSTTKEPTSTTPESITSEQTTTEQSTTSEQTTTQESSTTSEPTTAQSTSTSEITTTQEPTTSEKTTTTTQEIVTSEPTTTQATSEKTTTQQLTTSEQTTTQPPTTGEQTTTQQSTISEQTTTQQSTTGEQTTIQQSTTSEQTTTQPSTTSEQTTTQQSTTSEQTTTQQSTTSDQTTHQQSTTSEQTTTQQSTTSDQTTTPQSTTSEQTTTQQSTTSEQTTTQQSTASEQTTTQQFTTTTTDQTTTEESNTSQQTTTQQFTSTEQTTTQESFTSEPPTTQESSTGDQTTTQQPNTSETTTTEEPNQQTTEQLSTTEQTTEGTTTTDETTNQSTTQLSSTESDSGEDQLTTEEPYSEKECPETEDDQYLLVCPTSFKRHPKYCNMFYQCTEDDETYEAKTAMFKCPNNTIYDENQTQCVSEDKADKKCDGEIANKRRFKRLGLNYKDPIVADKRKLSCSTTGYFSFEKQGECAKGFLKCERIKNGRLRGYVYQCPDGYIFWSISKRCERTETVRDCKRSSNDWTGRWNIPVERKNVAAN